MSAYDSICMGVFLVVWLVVVIWLIKAIVQHPDPGGTMPPTRREDIVRLMAVLALLPLWMWTVWSLAS